MNAVEAMKAARDAGVDIALDGDGLVLQAPAPPPAAVLNALLRYKADIIALLRPAKDGWTDEDQVFHDERADIAPTHMMAAMETEGISWAEWKATALNRLFQEQGVIGQPGRITAATIRHGERKTGGDG
jgi:hypothetical protein